MTGYEVVDFVGLQALGVSWKRTHIDRQEKAGKFPKSFKLSDEPKARRVWWLHEIIDWLKRRAAKR